MSSSLLLGTLLREYVQLSTPQTPGNHVALNNDLPGGTLSSPSLTSVLMPDGSQAYGVDDPQSLGPIISATKDKAVRVVFYNLLPTGAKGDLFLPTDSSMMGSGMGPMNMAAPTDQGTVMDGVRNPACTEAPKGPNCFKDNRATLHLHGGATPWISDGTPAPVDGAGRRSHAVQRGASVEYVPDMWFDAQSVGQRRHAGATNDPVVDLLLHQRAERTADVLPRPPYGITRLNVYAGEAAPYVLQDPVEQKLSPAARSAPPSRQGPSPPPRSRWSSRTRPSSPASQLANEGPHLGHRPTGAAGQPLASARLHAQPEPRRHPGRQRHGALGLRLLVLPADGAATFGNPSRSTRNPLPVRHATA